MTTSGSTAPLLATPPLVPRQVLRGPAWFAIALPWLPVLLLRSLPDAASVASATAALRALGLSAGLLGYVSFATSLVLGARIPALERLFASLDRLYRFHRRLGELAARARVHVAVAVAERLPPCGDRDRPGGLDAVVTAQPS